MSQNRSTEDLVARLAAGLSPVRPLPPLHRQVLAVAAIWAGSAAVTAAWLGVHPQLALARGGISMTLAGVLVLVGVAGLTLGLACRIPGRERLALVAASAAALGFTVAVAIGLALPGSVADAGTLAQCMPCAWHSLLLAIPSGLLAMLLALRGAQWRHATSGVGIAIGATALGALLVHLSCPSPSPWHWLLAHALLPLASGVPAGLLAAWGLSRRGGRERRVSLDRLDG